MLRIVTVEGIFNENIPVLETIDIFTSDNKFQIIQDPIAGHLLTIDMISVFLKFFAVHRMTRGLGMARGAGARCWLFCPGLRIFTSIHIEGINLAKAWWSV
jgi:hypothetical protein